MNSVDRFAVLVLDPTVISRVLLGLEECPWLQLTVLSYRPNGFSERDKDAY